MNRRWSLGLGLGVLLAGASAFGAAWSGSGRLAAQDQPADPPAETAQPPVIAIDANLRALVALDTLPAAPAQLSLVEITLAPGASTQPFTNPGPTLIVVDNQAEVVLEASEATIDDGPQIAALVGIRSESSPSTPIAATLSNNHQVFLPPGAQARLHNTGDDEARLLLIVLASTAADAPRATPAA